MRVMYDYIAFAIIITAVLCGQEALKESALGELKYTVAIHEGKL